MFESSYGLFLIAVLVLALAPGPDLLYISARGLSQGPVAGLISALGIHTGVLIHTLIASFGLSALITSSAVTFGIIKYAGAAYLCYLGFKTLAPDRQSEHGQCISRDALKKVFCQGVITDILNPKVILFFLAFFPQFIDQNSPTAQSDIIVLGLIFVAVSLPIDAAVGLLAGSIRHHLGQINQRMNWGKWMAGSAFILLGISTALSTPPS